jgi:hypothetical protein
MPAMREGLQKLELPDLLKELGKAKKVITI